MPLEMSYEDLVRDLKDNVVMYQNKPVYVTGISRDGEVRFLDLGTQREGLAPFTVKDFCNPIRRVGFVNCMGGAAYLCRIPVRRYYIGLARHNTVVKLLPGVLYEEGGAATIRDRVRSLMIPEIGDCIMNKYPVLADACKQVKKFKGAVAFDTQFAVSSTGAIFYKDTHAGTCSLNTAKTVADIKWDEGQEHLSILLDNNHEKTVRDFRPTTR